MAQPLHRTILTALAAAWLSCGFSGMAGANTISSPFQDWEVGPIHAQSSNGVGYCSMKNFYEQGQGLVFARDAEGSSSFAISFPDKLLVSGGQYTAGLRIGAMSRQAVGLAGTPTVLIVQLGFDREVYRALQNEKMLSVTLKGKTFSFALDGTREALEVLVRCANTISQGKKFEPVKVTAVTQVLGNGVVVAPDPAAEQTLGQEAAQQTLMDEIARLQLENRKLMRENQMAMAKLLEAGETDVVPGIDLEEEIERQKQQEALSRNRKLVAANKSLQQQQAVAEEAILLPDIEPAAGGNAMPVKKIVPVVKHRTETARVRVQATNPPGTVIIVHKEESFLDGLLKKAGIGTAAGEYAWEGEGLYGAAEERPLHGAGLREAVGAYIEEVRGRCPGDFAHNIGTLHKVAGFDALEGELACLDGKNDAAAAIAFVGDKGKFAIITHEGPTDAMEAALVRRDSVISSLSR